MESPRITHHVMYVVVCVKQYKGLKAVMNLRAEVRVGIVSGRLCGSIPVGFLKLCEAGGVSRTSFQESQRTAARYCPH